ncbi:Alanyl-tRNA editing protein Aarsd1 [Apophysomyces sp. BC1034]|nr:Alanyl-tRNA editing protein Aarsd1 [Apophysomyces sp. BC1015]KAG0183224.1 Alanyl-tRNA editing protein Aarsd1 [Apophysomyces sp. BC1021]KAG0194396.1 Alanyl-tRNA editing protein Aarsd1 [Apophysomyces sp. BC1034]
MSPKQVPVGDLTCQRDTYLREFDTKCIACSEKPNKKGFYEVKLYDTILFPEGGGQPSDMGFIDNVKVYDVQRQKLEHVHLTKEPVEVDKDVRVTLDWDRRWDHVQQHSGQHLLSAVLEQEPFNIETVSWYMGTTKSYVELGTAKSKPPTAAQLEAVERKVNEQILAAVPVTLHVQTNEGRAVETLPEDYVGGVLRTIEIADLDRNTCCGTHVRHLGHLQCLKLLHTEKVRGGNTRVFFLVGQRVLQTLGELYSVSRQLTSLLSGDTLVENVQRLQLQSRDHFKQTKRLMAELAQFAAKDLLAQLEARRYGMLYREDADMDYLNLVATELRDKFQPDQVVVLAAGGKKTGGPIIIAGAADEVIQKTAKAVATVVDVKGGGKGRWQGKTKSWQGIEKVEEQLEKVML